MLKNKHHTYPLYPTTVFPDFRIMIDQTAEWFPDRTAISYKQKPSDGETVKVTYAEMRDRVTALTETLLLAGMRGKRVLLSGKNSVEWIVAYFALAVAGAVSVPVDRELPPSEMASVVSRAGCTGAIVDADLAAKSEALGFPADAFILTMGGQSSGKTLSDAIREGADARRAGANGYETVEIDPDALFSIVFTSGTTGQGKGVMLSQTNVVSDMTQGMYLFSITSRSMLVLPAHHTFGSTVNIVGHFAQGSEIYISSGIRYFTKELKEQQPTHLILVPLFLETLAKKIRSAAEKRGQGKKMARGLALSRALMKCGIDVSGKLFGEVKETLGGKLQMIICGGAPLSQSTIDLFEGLGVAILNGYGITECAPLISANRNQYRKKGSVGVPIVGEQIRIDDPDENGEGEICVKGPNVMLGYLDDAEATAAAFDGDGWFHTGDYGKLDKEGWIYITGRKKNLILFSNGKNVYPEEIETALAEIRGVGEVVVFAGEDRAHPEREVIVAEIWPDADELTTLGITDAQAYFDGEVRAVNDRMISYKRVGLVKIRETEFEKNASRKILRYKIDKTI